MSNKTWRFETKQVHVGQETPDPATDSRAVPIYQTTAFVFKDCQQAANRFGLSEGGNIYTRLMNPTNDVFEQRIAALEGGIAALGVASGSAAVSYSLQNIAKNGDHIVAASTLYGGSYNLLAHTFPDLGITTTFVDSDNVENFEKAIKPNTKAIFIESICNPNSSLVDVKAVADIAHKNGIPLIVDNTFATPYLFRPIEHGADVVVHSASKFIGGHGTTLGGVIIDSGKFDWAASGKFPTLTEPNKSYHGISFTRDVGAAAYIVKIRTTLLRDTGAALAPLNSFLFLQGLETLSLRVERHVENTLKIVDFLNNHPKVSKVNYASLNTSKYNNLYKTYFPKGAGSIFTFEIVGTEEKAKKFIDSLEIFSLLANVADVKSLVIHPASTTHSQMSSEELLESGIKENSIRLSIGTEHVDDLINDIENALSQI